VVHAREMHVRMGWDVGNRRDRSVTWLEAEMDVHGLELGGNWAIPFCVGRIADCWVQMSTHPSNKG